MSKEKIDFLEKKREESSEKMASSIFRMARFLLAGSIVSLFFPIVGWIIVIWGLKNFVFDVVSLSKNQVTDLDKQLKIREILPEKRQYEIAENEISLLKNLNHRLKNGDLKVLSIDTKSELSIKKEPGYDLLEISTENRIRIGKLTAINLRLISILDDISQDATKYKNLPKEKVERINTDLIWLNKKLKKETCFKEKISLGKLAFMKDQLEIIKQDLELELKNIITKAINAAIQKSEDYLLNSQLPVSSKQNTPINEKRPTFSANIRVLR